MAAVAAPTVNQCNGTDNVGGQAVECDVTVTNVLDLTTGVTPPTTTVRACHGAAGATPTCTATTTRDTVLVTSVEQCNSSGNGGGTQRVQCTVPASTTTSAVPVSINQCNGSGTAAVRS